MADRLYRPQINRPVRIKLQRPVLDLGRQLDLVRLEQVHPMEIAPIRVAAGEVAATAATTTGIVLRAVSSIKLGSMSASARRKCAWLMERRTSSLE